MLHNQNMSLPKSVGVSSPQSDVAPFSAFSVSLPKNRIDTCDLRAKNASNGQSKNISVQAKKLLQKIEKHMEKNPDTAFITEVDASVANHLMDSGLRMEYIDGKLIAKCMPYAVSGDTAGKVLASIILADRDLFGHSELELGTEQFVFLKSGNKKSPEGVIYIPEVQGKHEKIVTLVIEIGHRNSDEKTLQAMLNHATMEYIRAEQIPNLYLFLKIFENEHSLDEWVSCMGLFDLTGESAKLLWCCEFSSAPITTDFLKKRSKEIHDTLNNNRNRHLFSDDYKLTCCEEKWNEFEWSLQFAQLYDWIWEEDTKEFGDAFSFPLTDVAERLNAAIKKLHGVSAMEDVEEERMEEDVEMEEED